MDLRRLVSHCRRQGGQGLVELAVTLPVLLLAALAILQFALYSHAQNVVTTACAEGAIVASTADGTVADGTATARSLLAAGLGTSDGAVVVRGADSGPTVAVEAFGDVPMLVLGPAVRLPLHARSVMLKEER